MLDVEIRHQLGQMALDIGFTAPKGVTVLFGPSGAGKTTVINAVAGLIRPEHARISVAGHRQCDTANGIWVPPHKRQIGCIFQDARLFPHLSVRSNLTYGRWFSRRPPVSKFADIVDLLGLGLLLDRRPATLSGGEKQRVAIGRALLSNPKLILADEPLAALDEARKSEILPYFERLRDHVDIPILYVSHSIQEVARLATTVVALSQGRVLTSGTATQVLGDPVILHMGGKAAGAILHAQVICHHADGLTELNAGGQVILVPRLDQVVGSLVRIRVSAQDVILSRTPPKGLSALNIIEGAITDIRTEAGLGVVVSMGTSAGVILARLTQRSVGALGLRVGDTCHAIMKSVALAETGVP